MRVLDRGRDSNNPTRVRTAYDEVYIEARKDALKGIILRY